MRAAGKEIVAAIVLMMSFTVMLTLAAEYEIPLDDRYNIYDEYKENGISMVPKGCQHTCGNVSIYYPFGIGPSKHCYLNKWFLINCTKSSSDGVEKPFLSFFSHEKDSSVREILSISYSSQTITMKESFSPLCQTTNNLSVMSNTKLSGSPFFYSSGENRFMFYGCGSAVLTTPGQEFTMAGCKLSCSSNNTMPAAYDCNGINCCHFSLEYDVNAYQINITDSSLNACNYAFFLATSSSRYSLQRISNLVPEEKLVVPVVWRWSVTRDDFTSLPPHYSLDCYPYQSIYPPQLQGTYWNCGCKYPEEGNAYLPNGCQVRAWDRSEAEGRPMVPKGCRDKCGTVNIYYPFGIGNGNAGSKSCYLNKWFRINCTQFSDGSEKPYLSSISGGVEILGMSYDSQTITIKESISPSCQTTGSIKGSNFSLIPNTKLSGSPFFYSIGNNFMLFGCGNAFITMAGEELEQQGYKLNCSKNTAPKTAYDCHGINCHYLTFDYDVNTYQVNFTHSPINAPCNYAFFLSASSSLPPTLQSLPNRQQQVVVVPVELRWTITQDHVPPSYSKYCYPSTYINPQLQRHNYLQCNCRDGEGNAYMSDGCEWRDIDDEISNKKLRSAIIGVSASFGFVFLIWACVILYKAIKKRKMKKLREKFFKRNGGLLLQQQLLAKEGIVEKTTIFTATELDKATDHFNADRIVGRGGQGTVYKGMLIDGQIVAVKKSQAVDENQLEPFINEVVILSQINHRNVVKLMGCCLETEVPILVYEFIPNGTLFGLIHNNFDDELIPLSWDIRLRIASEVACALAYLHSATSVPIYHRDIKSGNILLDEKFRAKVSDFGTSRSISIDKTHFTTMVKGTFGYLDPEYFQSSQFTDKSDVYSFGVVLAELLTGQKPISFELDDDEDRSLVSRFLLCMEENRLMEILDVEVIEQGKKEDVVAMAWLAQRCLNFNGKRRPTMKEVAAELDTIKASHHSHLPSAAMETLEIESDYFIA
ncbi:wall-associated receptor kinase-like 5 isoform X2 [Ipomoea triloba]|uniref:wall-associated receptor kinase-like 5 isoform X2 n=1 Tax=Ipomoea triloba TaxID=35885 RepID=UPI00125E03C1|nr:wall-associated receptor kinase-like 5 isoform X2 [Ipomoea triloba]